LCFPEQESGFWVYSFSRVRSYLSVYGYAFVTYTVPGWRRLSVFWHSCLFFNRI
jgi:hypothetical protein